jgi:uncharacterized CHY-type Zn-finger protein
MERSKELKELVDKVGEQMWGNTLSDSHAKSNCIICGEKAEVFRDEMSYKEYDMSGLCQNCQDKTFGEEI